ncbi:MAG: LAGLIDADG family homing endonuclease [Nanoarchaeota archaeon]
MDTDEAYLNGYTRGDGNLYSYDHLFILDKKPKILRGYEICWGDKDREQLKIISTIIKQKFPNIIPKIYTRKNSRVLVLKCCRKIVFNYFKQLMTSDIGRENTEKIKFFIMGFCDAEADVALTTNGSNKGKRDYKPRIRITQKDKNFLLKIKKLLENNFGIGSNIYKKWKQDVHVLQIAGNKIVNLFSQKIGFRNPTKNKKLLSVQSSFNHNH